MKVFQTAAIVAVVSMACLASAEAQVVVPPGQDFYATPMSSAIATPVARIVTAAPAAPVRKARKRRAAR